MSFNHITAYEPDGWIDYSFCYCIRVRDGYLQFRRDFPTLYFPDRRRSSISWRHKMGTLSALLPLCKGNPPVTGGYLSYKSVMQILYVFFVVSLNKSLNKAETPWRSCDLNGVWYVFNTRVNLVCTDKQLITTSVLTRAYILAYFLTGLWWHR